MPSSSSTLPCHLTSQIRKAVGLLLWKCKNRVLTRTSSAMRSSPSLKASSSLTTMIKSSGSSNKSLLPHPSLLRLTYYRSLQLLFRLELMLAVLAQPRGKFCILSIDDEGMRGIVAGKGLAYLEQALKTKFGNQNARIAGYFNVAAGIGVGGIFTVMLFATKGGDRPIFHAEDTWKF
ncbi:hypothetical protein AAC387_Pa06g1984 [Persea americana]